MAEDYELKEKYVEDDIHELCCAVVNEGDTSLYDDIFYYYQGSEYYSDFVLSIYPLHIACKNGHMVCVKTFVEHGVDLNSRNTKPWRTPLHFAVIHEHLDCVKYLIQHGAKINEEDRFGNTPLHYAVSRNDLDILRNLIESGANINLKNKKGKTPLHIAGEKNLLEPIKIILDYDLPILYNEDRNGKTPFDYLTPENREIIQEYISYSSAFSVKQPEDY
jgi:ankyrin repeat protein